MRIEMKILVVLAYCTLFMAVLTIMFMLTDTPRLDVIASVVVIAIMIASSLVIEGEVARRVDSGGENK